MRPGTCACRLIGRRYSWRGAGETTDPWSRSGPLKSLKGPGAAAVVRALCDFRPPYTLTELAVRACLPLPTVFRVVNLLVSDALVDKSSQRGPITAVDWQRVLIRWTQDYSVTESNRVLACIDPRGIPAAVEKLKSVGVRYAVSGSLAATRVVLASPTRLLELYAEDPETLSEQLGLSSTDAGANVLVLEPFSSAVFERTLEVEGVVFAAFSQVAADLLTSPGRGPSEAEALIAWMESNEGEWRA